MMLSKIRSILKSKRYRLFSRPYELNIVGLRSKTVEAGKFDDEIHVFYKEENNKWNYHVYRATTDPGTYWLKNPSSKMGTAILSQGQYKDAYKIGKHKGQYTALVQHKPVNIIRDYDRNATLDIRNGKKAKGLFGINIHHALSKGKTFSVDKWSAGCQVFQDVKDFEVFIKMCKKHEGLYGNNFTYTLLDFRAVRRENTKRVAMAATFITSLIMGIFFSEGKKKTERRKKR